MTELADVIALFRHWMTEHNLDRDDIRIEITFPDNRTSHLADRQVALEWRPEYGFRSWGGAQVLHDVQFLFGPHERSKWIDRARSRR